MSTTTISFRTDRETKEEAMRLFSELGLDMSTALNMFLRQALVDNGIPFTRVAKTLPALAHATKQKMGWGRSSRLLMS
ncbi:type II toxin-antitoxin system RelB/DinJ family antitoxin [Rothia sp. P5766]|uniref:type II toxin-antitoxin system RelB/DinJ family antitoxin n=1 Tax=Rothia sp. P5766 TaxID=3402656 RepID=UPI003ADFBD15